MSKLAKILGLKKGREIAHVAFVAGPVTGEILLRLEAGGRLYVDGFTTDGEGSALGPLLGRAGEQCLGLRDAVLRTVKLDAPGGDALKVAHLLGRVAAATAAYHDRPVCTCGAVGAHDTTCRVFRRPAVQDDAYLEGY